MANLNSPNGFQYFGRLEGGSPTEGLTPRLVSSADTAALGFGDAVTALATGYVTASVASDEVAGIFYGCSYLSTAIGRVVTTNYWPGSGAGSDVSVLLCTDPQATFVVQSDNTAIVFADIGANVNLVVGVPNATTQFSTAAVGQSTLSTSTTLPFRVVGLLSQSAPPGTASTDNTTPYNRVIVSANNWDRKSLTGV